MIYQHTIDWVLGVSPHTGKPKTNTRRLFSPDHRFTMPLARVVIGKDYGRVIQTVPTPANAASKGSNVWSVWSAAYRRKWEVGFTYAVQRGRGVKAEGRIRITGIRREDVRNISEADVKAEGFETREDFYMTWLKMHDPALYVLRDDFEPDKFLAVTPDGNPWLWTATQFTEQLASRPTERYQAWAIEFELI